MLDSGVGTASHAAQDLDGCCTDSKAACWGALACHTVAPYSTTGLTTASSMIDAFHITVQAHVTEDAPQHPLHPQALVLQDLSMLLPATVSTELDPQVPVVSILGELL